MMRRDVGIAPYEGNGCGAMGASRPAKATAAARCGHRALRRERLRRDVGVAPYGSGVRRDVGIAPCGVTAAP